MRRAIFLDRDGVIIENRASYVRSWNDVTIFHQALRALRQIVNRPEPIVIVTNQSVVGRGIISRAQADDINQQLIREIERAGGRIDAIFLCPHAPTDHCVCRKPRPGLLYDAARALNLDLATSIMIGDALTDVAAGKAAGVARSVLVRTGRGTAQLRLIDQETAPQMRPDAVYNSLLSALAALLTP